MSFPIHIVLDLNRVQADYFSVQVQECYAAF
jgi:hypothetical protein